MFARRSRRWWETVPDPRALSIAFGVGYLVTLLTGIGILFYPPNTVIGALDGRASISIMAVLLIVGAIIAIPAGWREYWRAERVGLFLMAMPWLLYGTLQILLHFSQTGSRIFALGAVLVALCFYCSRMVMIWGYTYRPGSRPQLATDEIEMRQCRRRES